MKRLYFVRITYLTHYDSVRVQEFYVYSRNECNSVAICLRYLQESPDVDFRIFYLVDTFCEIVHNFLK